jgi:hypothetical protein
VLGASAKADIAELAASTKKDMAGIGGEILEAETRITRWTVGTIVAVAFSVARFTH